MGIYMRVIVGVGLSAPLHFSSTLCIVPNSSVGLNGRKPTIQSVNRSLTTVSRVSSTPFQNVYLRSANGLLGQNYR